MVLIGENRHMLSTVHKKKFKSYRNIVKGNLFLNKHDCM
jgi:hypothetical protein